MKIFEWAGIGFGEVEAYRIMKSLKVNIHLIFPIIITLFIKSNKFYQSVNILLYLFLATINNTILKQSNSLRIYFMQAKILVLLLRFLILVSLDSLVIQI